MTFYYHQTFKGSNQFFYKCMCSLLSTIAVSLLKKILSYRSNSLWGLFVAVLFYLLWAEDQPSCYLSFKGTIETTEQCLFTPMFVYNNFKVQMSSSMVKFKVTNISDVVLVSLMLTLNIIHTSGVSIVDFEELNAGWEVITRLKIK